MDRAGLSGRQLADKLRPVPHERVPSPLAPRTARAVQEARGAGRSGPLGRGRIARIPDVGLQSEVAQAAVAGGLIPASHRLVRAVKSKRPAPAARPDPYVVDVGDGVTVTVRVAQGERPFRGSGAEEGPQDYRGPGQARCGGLTTPVQSGMTHPHVGRCCCSRAFVPECSPPSGIIVGRPSPLPGLCGSASFGNAGRKAGLASYGGPTPWDDWLRSGTARGAAFEALP